MKNIIDKNHMITIRGIIPLQKKIIIKKMMRL
jgi:hypothetical protein